MNRSGNRFARASRAEGSQARPRTPLPHPDADRLTRRMSYEQLRALVVELIDTLEPEPDPDDDPVNEFETAKTTFRPGKSRAGTLDDLIAWLRTAPPLPVEALTPKPRRRD